MPAFAATGDTITTDGTWYGKWDIPEEHSWFNLKATKTALFVIKINATYDQEEIVEITVDGSNTQVNRVDDNHLKSIPVLLQKDKTYRVSCTCYGDRSGRRYYRGGEMTVTAEDVTAAQPTLSATPIQASFNAANSRRGWFNYKSAAAGDYALTFSGVVGYVSVYSKQSGQKEQSEATFYFLKEVRKTRTLLRLSLAANTEYLVCFGGIESDTQTSLAISKCAENMTDIDLVEREFKYSFNDTRYLDYPFAAEDFSYKITYSGGTDATKNYTTLMSEGYPAATVTFVGKVSGVNDLVLPAAGKKLFKLSYSGKEKDYFFRVYSMVDAFIAEGIGANAQDTPLNIYYLDSSAHRAAWRIKVKETGLYNITYYAGETSMDEAFSDYMFEFIDEENSVIKYCGDYAATPLIGGREYILSLKYQYKAGVTQSVRFLVHKSKYYPSQFPDVQDSSAWFYEPIMSAAGRGIITGYQNGYFGVADGIQRQDFLVILSRTAGISNEAYNYRSKFPDVPAEDYYEAAINWGVENGIVSGYLDGRFGVGDTVNREQLVSFFQRYAKYMGADVTVTQNDINTVKAKFKDFNEVTDFAVEPIVWAVKNGIISGKTPTTVYPAGTAQRCEVASILYNIFKNKLF